MNKNCDSFYRVIVTLPGVDGDVSLAFDFKYSAEAIAFADMAFKSCDEYQVRIDFIVNEIDTTNSPMWR